MSNQDGIRAGGGMGVKEHIPGAATDARPSAGGAMSAVSDVVSNTPEKIARQTKGSPMAAGLVAFGVGLLLSAVLPASRREAQAAAALKEQAQPLVGQLGSVAKEAVGNLQEPAETALESVKSTASEAVDTVKEEGTSAAGGVKDQAQDAKHAVQERTGH